MSNILFKGFSLFKWFFFFLLLILLSSYFILLGSLPDLDGKKTLTLLQQSLKIERDVQGIPTISAQNRSDTAFALGYVHAQERYFQMDLLRRSATGELSVLLGTRLLARDKKIRIHRFKDRAKKILQNLPKAHYRAIQAYTNGVNAGIDALNNDPYQYLLLGELPKPWEAEDSLLCVFAMYFDLNDELGETKTSLAIMRDTLPAQWFDFLTPKGGKWDAVLDDGKLSESDTTLRIPETQYKLKEVSFSDQPKQEIDKSIYQAETIDSHFLPGSNSMVIDASLTPYASAMLANDMHLTLRVPNIWYRASWFLADGRRVNGVTLPGTPVMIAGSNENIAWGFTNSYGDWGDIITLTTNAENTQYLTAEGWKDFTIYNHIIETNRTKKENYISIETIWGPVTGKNHKGELIAHQWIAYSPQAVNMNLFELEKAKSVPEALTIAAAMGLPPQNIVLADDAGRIAWTIAGAIPDRERKNASGEIKRGWRNYLPAKDYPVFSARESHRIWTANNRLFSGKELALTGFEGGDLGARAQQIRDALRAKEKFQERDLLAIQLDNRGVFLQRWKQLLADSLELANSREPANSPEPADSPKKTAGDNSSKKAPLLLMAEVLNKEETLSADPDSVAYGLVKSFRGQVVNATVGWIYDSLEKQQPNLFKRSSIDKLIEYPVWELLSKRPEHLTPEGYNNWHEFLIASAKKAYNEITYDGQAVLAQQSWGTLHKINIRHPLSSAIPGLGLLLDMADSPLSGDRNMPKVMGSKFGAAVRMVVSPGQEKNGIMHMPAGQSSHPLSSYYSKGHQDWLDGKASSFLPGESEWVLELNAIY